MIRKPIIAVLGHVDHGKTLLLDAVRGSTVAEREAGKITQHIGATEVPIEVVKRIAGPLLQKYGFDLKIPGLLFIDTPGHEAFTNLRKRGGSIADLAVLVVDVMQGVQPQTKEAIEILKTYKVPFVVAANKVDMVQGFSGEKMSATDALAQQQDHVEVALDEKIYKLAGELWKYGFACERFDKVTDFTKQVAIIPTSAKKDVGMSEVLLFLAGLSQRYLEKKLAHQVEGPGKGTVLECKEEKGLGKTVDVILYDGTIRAGDEIVLGAFDGVIRTKVRALLQPKPMDEIRDPREKFNSQKEVSAAAGVKIAAPGLDNALAGSPLLVVADGSEEAKVRSEIAGVEIKSEDVGVAVRADALGSLEALVKLLENHGVPVRAAHLGNVTRRDVVEAQGIAEKNPHHAAIMAFNVKVNPAAEQLLAEGKAKLFEGRVVYQIIEEYQKWVEAQKEAEKKKALETLTLPARAQVMTGCIFRNSGPCIVGMRVQEGVLRPDANLFSQKNGVVGKVKAIQDKGKSITEAKTGDEVAVSIEGAVVGKNVFEGDTLHAYIPKDQHAALLQNADLLTPAQKALLEETVAAQAKIPKKK